MSSRARTWAYSCAAAVALGVVIWLLATAGGRPVRLWLTVALTLGIAVIALALVELWPQTVADLPDVSTPWAAGGSDRESGGLLRTRRQLERARDDADRSDQVRDRLRAVTEHRLRAHGIDPAVDPQAARRLVGDEVWALMTSERSVLLPARTIDTWLATVEQL